MSDINRIKVNISKKVFNSKYLPLLDCDKRYLILYGGAGSGKSYFAAQRYIYKLMTSELCNLMVVRAVDKTNRDSTFALLKQVISNWGVGELFEIREGDMRIKCTHTGNNVIFKGVADVENLKSVTFDNGILTDIWIEEASEIEEEDFNQLNVRLRGAKNLKKQITLSFNPISATHWLKKRFFDKRKFNEKFTIQILHSTYKDNKFLDEDYKETLESYKEVDPYFYDVYCLGRWGTVGKSVFNGHNVSVQLDKEVQPIKTGCFLFSETGRHRFVPGDYIKIYKEPIEGHPYVIGGDTAGDGADNFTAQVIDNSTGEQVAVLKHQFDEDLYAKQMFCLGMHYNTALIAIETNFSTYPIKEMQRMRYPKLFVRTKEDTYTGQIMESYGFKTDRKTRPLIISELVKIMRDTPEWVVDEDTLEEMLVFVRSEKGRAEAQSGFHDDLIMALAIAYYARSQQRSTVAKPKDRIKWTDEMKKDYKKASKADKILLERLWGRPQ